MEYDIKKGWFKNIDGDLLENMMSEVFGNVEKDGDVLVSSYGVLERIEAPEGEDMSLAETVPDS